MGAAGLPRDRYPDSAARRARRRWNGAARLLPRARGRVLNAAIDKYVHVIVKQRFDDDIYINYSKKEVVSRVEDIEHELVREAMHMTGVRSGVAITTLADIPSAGSGLGSSSSVTVGLLHALFAYQGHQASAAELADRACAIEIDRCRKPIGKQDQYVAAFGGICDIHFGPGDRVSVDKISMPAPLRRRVQSELLLFLTGITRNADTILGEQTANIGGQLEQLTQLRDLAGEAAHGLREGNINAVGFALTKSWEAKRTLATGVEPSDRRGRGGSPFHRRHRRESDRRRRRRLPACRVPTGGPARSSRSVGKYQGAAYQGQTARLSGHL
jgi:galactokinase/mevalonate kinase-like predicted kinase